MHSSLSSRPLRRLCRSLLAAAATGALLVGPLTSSAPAAGDPGFHQPSVGECHRLSDADIRASSSTKPAVDCATRHTSRTVAVVRFASSPDWSDEVGLFAKIGERCYQGRNAALGATDRLRSQSAYNLAYFIPTRAERAAGARWARCDLILWGNHKVKALPVATTPLLKAPLTDQVAACRYGQGGAYPTVCADAHGYRATGVARMPFKKHPSDARAARFALRKCPALVSSRGFFSDSPSRFEWQAGDRFLVCFSKTRK